MKISEILKSSRRLAVETAQNLTGVAPAGFPIPGSTSFLASVAGIITIENFSKLKTRLTELQGSIKFISLLYEMSSNKSMVERKFDGS